MARAASVMAQVATAYSIDGGNHRIAHYSTSVTVQFAGDLVDNFVKVKDSSMTAIAPPLFEFCAK